MSAISTWSVVAASNDMAVPNGWPEGQPPSSVNDCARENMAAIRTWYNDPIWIDYGTAVSYVSGTVFKVGSDLTQYYNKSRRVKLYGPSDSTFYGTIVDSTYVTASAATSVTVDLDDSTSLNGSLSQAWYSAIDPTANPISASSSREDNVLVASDFTTAPWQQGEAFTATVSDATYYVDNWIQLCDAASDVINITRNATDNSLVMTIETGSKKFGMIQWLEHAKVLPLIYFGQVSIMIEAKASAALNLRVGVVKFTGTADTGLAKECVSAWNVQGTDPTLVANYTFENTPTDFALAAGAAFNTFKIEGVTVDSNTSNIGLFFWIDSTTGQVADTITITRIKMQPSETATYFDYSDPVAALIDAQAYYEMSYSNGVTPGASAAAGTISSIYYGSLSSTYSLALYDFSTEFRVVKIRTPTVNFYSPLGSVSNTMHELATDGGSETGNVAVTAISETSPKCTGYPTVTLETTTGYYYRLSGHFTADARLGS